MLNYHCFHIINLAGDLCYINLLGYFNADILLKNSHLYCKVVMVCDSFVVLFLGFSNMKLPMSCK